MNNHLVAVTLFVVEGREDSFRVYERKVLSIAREYGGALVRAARVSDKASGELAPYEFHLLCFPTGEEFASFRSDPNYIKLSSEKSGVISKAIVVEGSELPVESLHAGDKTRRE